MKNRRRKQLCASELECVAHNGKMSHMKIERKERGRIRQTSTYPDGTITSRVDEYEASVRIDAEPQAPLRSKRANGSVWRSMRWIGSWIVAYVGTDSIFDSLWHSLQALMMILVGGG